MYKLNSIGYTTSVLVNDNLLGTPCVFIVESRSKL